MSSSACSARLEGIDGVALGAGSDKWLEGPTVRHIHATGKQVGQILSDADILKRPNQRFRLHLNQDVDVACGFGLASRKGTEQSGVQHATASEFWFVCPKGCYHLIAVHT